MKFFYVFMFKVLNIVLFNQNKNANVLYKKIIQSLNKTTKKNLIDVVQL